MLPEIWKPSLTDKNSINKYKEKASLGSEKFGAMFKNQPQSLYSTFKNFQLIKNPDC